MAGGRACLPLDRHECVPCGMDAAEKSISFDPDEILPQLAAWAEDGYYLEGIPDKHTVLAQQEERSYYLRLPMMWPPPTGRPFDLPAYTAALPDESPPYLLMLVQLGAAAIGVWEDGEWAAHKAIKKYMKRHKRGKAQISYLNTRGKSKAGSRVRLANTVAFFEEINERLHDWEELYAPEAILVSCTAQVWGLLFQAKTPPPFEKKDPRLRRVPHNVHIPDFAELQRIQHLVAQGWLR